MKIFFKIVIGFFIWVAIVANTPENVSLGITICLIFWGVYKLINTININTNNNPQPQRLPFYHFEGIKFLNQNEAVGVEISQNSILIFQNKEKVVLDISYNSINNVLVLQEIENTESNKSVLGRALTGGLLLGPVGAVVGGMSGVGTKTKSKTNYYLEISYDDNKVILKPFMNSENIVNITKKKIVDKIEGAECQ